MDFCTIEMCWGFAIRLRFLHLRSDSVRDVDEISRRVGMCRVIKLENEYILV